MKRTYRIVRMFREDYDSIVVKTGLTLEDAREHCRNPETSSSTCKGAEKISVTSRLGPWFDGYEEEK